MRVCLCALNVSHMGSMEAVTSKLNGIFLGFLHAVHTTAGTRQPYHHQWCSNVGHITRVPSGRANCTTPPPPPPPPPRVTCDGRWWLPTLHTASADAYRADEYDGAAAPGCWVDTCEATAAVEARAPSPPEFAGAWWLYNGTLLSPPCAGVCTCGGKTRGVACQDTAVGAASVAAPVCSGAATAAGGDTDDNDDAWRWVGSQDCRGCCRCCCCGCGRTCCCCTRCCTCCKVVDGCCRGSCDGMATPDDAATPSRGVPGDTEGGAART